MAYGFNIRNSNNVLCYSTEDPGSYIVTKKVTLSCATLLTGSASVIPIGSPRYGVNAWQTYLGTLQQPVVASTWSLIFVSIPVGSCMTYYNQFGSRLASYNGFDGGLTNRWVSHDIGVTSAASPAVVKVAYATPVVDLTAAGINPAGTGYGLETYNSNGSLHLSSSVEVLNILSTTTLPPIPATILVPAMTIDSVGGEPYFCINSLGRYDAVANMVYTYQVFRQSENTFKIAKAGLSCTVSASSTINQIDSIGVYVGRTGTSTIQFCRLSQT